MTGVEGIYYWAFRELIIDWNWTKIDINALVSRAVTRKPRLQEVWQQCWHWIHYAICQTAGKEGGRNLKGSWFQAEWTSWCIPSDKQIVSWRRRFVFFPVCGGLEDGVSCCV